MRMLVFALLIFALLLGFGTYSYYYINDTASALLDSLDPLEENVWSGNWYEAEKKFAMLRAAWDETSPKWTSLLDHQELDNINITMTRVGKFMETKDMPGFMSELAELRMLIEHIPEKEAISIANIF